MRAAACDAPLVPCACSACTQPHTHKHVSLPPPCTHRLRRQPRDAGVARADPGAAAPRVWPPQPAHVRRRRRRRAQRRVPRRRGADRGARGGARARARHRGARARRGRRRRRALRGAHPRRRRAAGGAALPGGRAGLPRVPRCVCDDVGVVGVGFCSGARSDSALWPASCGEVPSQPAAPRPIHILSANPLTQTQHHDSKQAPT